MNASQEFFTQLATLHQHQATAAIFAITEKDRMLVVAFVEGQIKGMRFGVMTGPAVLSALETVAIKSVSVKEDKSIPAQTLPPTSEILKKLSSRIPADALKQALDTVKRSSDTAAPSQSKRVLMYRGQVVEPEQPPAGVPQKRVLMYRGQVVEPEQPPAGMPQKRVMTYRGQVVGEAPAPQPSEVAEPADKPVRMYRGQIIA
ncbi:hypothetical protein IQ266_21525 [filamentous cyanobacterium LEGE 11480]|uniref:Uncharacterized protein n=1 Tax=Romeriopsis navalis LEGE 11480 TaxID=2777977 RepID=A0A928VRB8_9CYAN|nr:DUF4278 domain-containing protein [Romeriopsis navalis]MBE9032322.1 hypothetical protein [Romeriopsis navalis LEGE 11480]